jgi:hypothetical protein
VGEGVQGPEGNEGVPDVSAPEPGAGGGGDRPRDDGAQAAEHRVEYCEKGGEIVSRARGPYVGQGHLRATSADLAKRKLAVP